MNDDFKTARLAAGYTHQALADHVGVHRTYIQRIEVGRRRPSFGLAVRLSSALNLPIRQLREGRSDA